jgi:hypothetical protein
MSFIGLSQTIITFLGRRLSLFNAKRNIVGCGFSIHASSEVIK